MAARFFINGGVNNLWSSTTNWSTTSGGAGGSSVPGLSDAVTLDTNSPNCTVDGTTGLLVASLDCSTYTNQLTLNNIIICGGNITLGSSMQPILGNGAFSFTSAGTKQFTSNGIKVPNLVLNATSPTVQLIDDIYVRKCFYFAGTNFLTGGKTVVALGGTIFITSTSSTTITATLNNLNPTKMGCNGSIAANNSKQILIGYNQSHNYSKGT